MCSVSAPYSFTLLFIFFISSPAAVFCPAHPSATSTFFVMFLAADPVKSNFPALFYQISCHPLPLSSSCQPLPARAVCPLALATTNVISSHQIIQAESKSASISLFSSLHTFPRVKSQTIIFAISLCPFISSMKRTLGLDASLLSFNW